MAHTIPQWLKNVRTRFGATWFIDAGAFKSSNLTAVFDDIVQLVSVTIDVEVM